MKIIRTTVNDHRSSNDLLHMEPVRKHLHIRFSMIAQQRRQVSGMIRMYRFPRIKVSAGVREALTCAAAALVDMERKESRFRLRKTCQLRFQYQSILPLKKTYQAP